ncbi:MAG: energy transducer TonB [Steroidobacteraceae bacterium]
MLLAPAMWGDSSLSKPRIPDAYGAGANAGTPGEGEEQRLILIDLHTSLSPPENVVEAHTLARLEAPSSILHIVGPDSLPQIPLETSEEGEAEEPSEADLMARTKLAGLYEGQMRARIERAWMRPREAAEAGGFACRVKIRQDRRGQINEVELERCNGSVAWQQSLVSAINAASPLPAPPDTAVFVDAFSMTFRSQGYVAGGPDEGYAPEGRRVAALRPEAIVVVYSADPVSDSSPAEQSGDATLRTVMSTSDGVVELTANGNQLTWAIREKKENKSVPSQP